jgi:hypothetical protein
VPLGRILEPVGRERFAALRDRFARWQDSPVAATHIAEVQLIHETRWYMEERESLARYALAARAARGLP